MSIQGKRLHRIPLQGKIAGVCAGLADYFEIDVTLVRILFLIAVFCAFGGLGIYLICWLCMPER